MKQLKANEAYKILGMHIAPDKNQKAQVEKMKEQAQKWTNNMKSWKVSPVLQNLSYKVNLWPALRYPLGVCQQTEREIEEVVRNLRPQLKHANYLSAKFSNDILHLPLKYGGYGVHHMYKYMVCEQAKMLLHALRTDENTGRKARILLEYHQLESGRKNSVPKITE